jgi:hypothetical protein
MARKRRGKNGQELGWYFIEPATIWRWSLKKSKLILRATTHTQGGGLDDIWMGGGRQIYFPKNVVGRVN